ncbi:AraC family transcriptional regulator [Yoonia sp. BS5-3]|uniref:Helix-turn-helix domain-containing protein n=1 Tax=Yoonia phaeophyticola TaxID=3137369 RepID=A0ABZ2V4U3_9RHOB
MSTALAVSHGYFGRAAIYDLNRPITTHAHREGHLIFMVGGNHATVTIGSRSFECDETFAAAISPWAQHSFEPASEGSTQCLVLYIRPMWFLENTGSSDYALSFGRARLQMTDTLKDMLNRLVRLMMSDSLDLNVEDLLIDLTSQCYEASWVERTRPCNLQAHRSFSDFRVRRSQQLMKNYLCDHNGLDALASEVGLSRPHFFKLFKRQTGVTPNVYFNTLRSERAIDDLLSTNKSVTDIAHDLGFASQASFTRFFSLNVGISPTDYRRVARIS